VPGLTAEILAALAQNAGVAVEQAMSLPPAIYHDAEILQLETQKLFRQDWICIGRTAEIPAPGDYVSRTIIDTPVFCIRQKDGTIRAFANTCLHRGAELLCGDGHATRITCPYHSWTYDIAGQLIGAPFMQRSKGFATRDFRLQTLASEIWQGFIYVSLAKQPHSLPDALLGLTKLVADFRMADYVPVFAMEESWDANWKCLVENFMDAYHVHRVHRNSFGKSGTSEDITFLFPGDEQFAYHLIQEDEQRKSVDAHPANTWLKGDDRFKTYLVNIFPAHVMQLQPDMLWYLSILPDGIDRISIRWGVSIPAEILDAAPNRQHEIDRVMALIHQVNSEDRPIVENIFRTTRSPFAVRGPFSWLERNVWDFGRYLARRLCATGSVVK
jgi:phenylpropionate dioxygenase-like ring-hydroxylating dioxygenase large terminal subunit